VKRYRSPSIDQIPADLFQEGSNTLSSEIYTLINSIWVKELPQQCKEAINVPMYEKWDKTDCSNHKEASVLPTTYEIFYNTLI
jgi:hypothetical protein